MTKIKVVALDNIYNFPVHTFFISIGLGSQTFISKFSKVNPRETTI